MNEQLAPAIECLENVLRYAQLSAGSDSAIFYALTTLRSIKYEEENRHNGWSLGDQVKPSERGSLPEGTKVVYPDGSVRTRGVDLPWGNNGTTGFYSVEIIELPS